MLSLICGITGVIIFQNVILVTKCQERVSLNSPLPRQIKMSRNASPSTIRKTVSLMASINYGGYLYPTASMCTKSMQLALDRVGQMPNVLTDYDIVIEPYDDMCNRPIMVQQTITRLKSIDITKTQIPLTLGGICSGHLHTGQMLHHYNFVGVTAMTTLPDLQMYRRRYRGYYVLGVAPGVAYQGLIEFIWTMGWRRMAIFSEIAPYWQPLENQVVTDLEKRGMTLLGIFKVSSTPFDDIQIRTAIEDMIAIQPRIVLIYSSMPARVACWLYLYGIYGPKFVFFLQATLSFLPTDLIRYPWCTEKMLTEVLPTFILFGDSAKGDILGPSEGDASGLTTAKYLDSIQAVIYDKLASNQYWPFWGMLCYEMTFFSALWLDHVESFLRQRNETLSDWVTSGEKFQQNGTVFFDLMMKSLYSFKLKGLRGDYAFDPTTDENTGGGSFSPSGFFQIRANTSSYVVEKVPIAYYKISDPATMPLVVKWDKMLWLTSDGKPPSDSVEVLDLAVPVIVEPSSYLAISVSGALLIAIEAIFLVLQCTRRN